MSIILVSSVLNITFGLHEIHMIVAQEKVVMLHFELLK